MRGIDRLLRFPFRDFDDGAVARARMIVASRSIARFSFRKVGTRFRTS
jgi:hypothetical protein